MNLYIFLTSLFFLFFHSWSFGVVLWEMATLGEWTVILQFIVVMFNLRLTDKSKKHFSWSMTLIDRRNDVKMLKTHARPAG